MHIVISKRVTRNLLRTVRECGSIYDEEIIKLAVIGSNAGTHGTHTYHPSSDKAYGRLSTPAPTMAVTLWKAEYHHLAFLDEVIGSQSSMAFSFEVLSSAPCKLVSMALSAGTAIAGSQQGMSDGDISLLTERSLRSNNFLTASSFSEHAGAKLQNHGKRLNFSIKSVY
jgi:hypothetical protein